MANLSPTRIWTMRAGFVVLAFVIMFLHLLPLSTRPHNWAPPDLLIAFAFAWVLRRPDYVPALSLGLVMLMADLLFQRPPGLLACLVVLGAEYLRNRNTGQSETSFVLEWISVAVVLVAITVINRMILVILGVQQPALGLILIQTLMTIAAYPLVVLVTHSLMGVRKLTPSDAEALGARS